MKKKREIENKKMKNDLLTTARRIKNTVTAQVK